MATPARWSNPEGWNRPARVAFAGMSEVNHQDPAQQVVLEGDAEVIPAAAYTEAGQVDPKISGADVVVAGFAKQRYGNEFFSALGVVTKVLHEVSGLGTFMHHDAPALVAHVLRLPERQFALGLHLAPFNVGPHCMSNIGFSASYHGSLLRHDDQTRSVIEEGVDQAGRTKTGLELPILRFCAFNLHWKVFAE